MNTLMPGGPSDQPIVHFPNLPVPWCYMTFEQLAAMNNVVQPSMSLPPPPIPEPPLLLPNEPEIQPDLDSTSGTISDVSLMHKHIHPEASGDEADSEEPSRPVKRQNRKKKHHGGEDEKVLSMPKGQLMEPQKGVRKELQVCHNHHHMYRI